MISDKKKLVLLSTLALQSVTYDIYSVEKKNVLFILTDDLGWKDLGCNESVFYENPNIDKLAAEGMFFTHVYSAAPVSALARGAIMSGKFPLRNGYTGLSGQSFVELLKGNDMKHKPVFWHSPHYFNNGGYPFSAVYKDGWKYVYRYDLNKEYLYNIHNDISELDNKVETETNRRNKLRKLLDRYLKEVKAKYPKENNNYKEYKL